AAAPMITFLGTRAYVDFFTLLFALLSYLGLVCWRRSRRAPWLLLAGAAAGLALATKYAALSVVIVVGAGVFAAAWLEYWSSGAIGVRPDERRRTKDEGDPSCVVRRSSFVRHL